MRVCMDMLVGERVPPGGCNDMKTNVIDTVSDETTMKDRLTRTQFDWVPPDWAVRGEPKCIFWSSRSFCPPPSSPCPPLGLNTLT